MCIKELKLKLALKKSCKYCNDESGVKVWAHRGCCFENVENTLPAFEKACEIDGVEGIELDVQLSKDGEVMVYHDENLKRLMGIDDLLCNRTAKELKALEFLKGTGGLTVIPTLKEVFEAVKPYMISKGIFINIELKNSVLEYYGMEEKVISLVQEYGIADKVIYSSFNGNSLKKIKQLNKDAKTGILKTNIKMCEKFADENKVDALHPSIKTALKYKTNSSIPVRVWNTCEPFYGEKKHIKIFDLNKLKACGITDIITNYPELYLCRNERA